MNIISGFAVGDILKYGLLDLYDRRGTVLLIVSVILLLIAGYLIGGINTSILYSKLRYGKDIRESGSGNAGLTNMLRTYGKGAAAVTLFGDIAKTAICCLIGAIVLGKTGAFICGYGAVIGHIWPVWFKFRGGKGVLALATVILICSPVTFLICITVFFIIVAFTKYISLGSVICALLMPVVLARIMGTANLVIIPTVIICLIIVWKHRSNIKRLREGNENKIHLGKNNTFLPNRILIPIAVLLAGASVLTVALSFRRSYAVSYDGSKLTAEQMRILFIDEKIKTFGGGEMSDEKDDEIMEAAKKRAARIMILGSAAQSESRAISDGGKKTAESFFTDTQSLYGYREGEKTEIYVSRVYGSNVLPSDVISILYDEIYADEYEAAAPDKATRLLEEESGKVDFARKVISGIIKEY